MGLSNPNMRLSNPNMRLSNPNMRLSNPKVRLSMLAILAWYDKDSPPTPHLYNSHELCARLVMDGWSAVAGSSKQFKKQKESNN